LTVFRSKVGERAHFSVGVYIGSCAMFKEQGNNICMPKICGMMQSRFLADIGPHSCTMTNPKLDEFKGAVSRSALEWVPTSMIRGIWVGTSFKKEFNGLDMATCSHQQWLAM
jgi:hypothetical protein